MSASSAMKHPEGNKDVVGSCRSITELQEESARLLVDSLRKEIFAAQKNNGGFSTLILRIQEVSIALNGSRTTPAKCTPSIVATKSHNTVGSNSGSVDNFGNANEKPIYYHHHCSIVLSLYTLFTRVLASSAIAVPAISDNSDDNREGAYSAYNATSSSAKNQPPIPSSTAHSISDLLLPLRIQSLSLLCSAASYDPNLFLPNWQLFLSDSLAIDKVLQNSMDFGIKYLLPKVKAQLPSRLPLFVSLSRGASADGILHPSTDRTVPDFFRTVDLPKVAESSMRLKSILLTGATTGLTLYPISCYYPHLVSAANATSPQLSSPSSSFILSTYVPGDDCVPMSHQKFSPTAKATATKHEGGSSPDTSKISAPPNQRSSLPLEVAARCQAINVLEAMVGGLELGKWFLGVSSISSSSVQKGGSGDKVANFVLKILRFLFLMLHWENDKSVMEAVLRTISALLLSLPLLSGPFHGNSVSRNSGIMNILEDTATCIFHRVLVLSVLGNSPVELITSQSPSSSNIVRPGSNSSSNSNSVPTQHAAPYNKSSACNNSNSSRYSSISSSSSKHVNSADIKVVNSVSTTVNSEIQIMAALWISEISKRPTTLRSFSRALQVPLTICTTSKAFISLARLSAGVITSKVPDASVDSNNPFPTCVPTVWRRASATPATVEIPGKTMDTIKSVEGGWRRNTLNGMRKPDDSRGPVNNVDKKGTSAVEVIIRMPKQIYLTVFLPRLVAAYCLNPSSGDVGLNAAHLTIYRSLFYSLSSYYPDVVLIDLSRKQLVPTRRMSQHAGISPGFPCLIPEGSQLEKYSFGGETVGTEEETSWLVALILSLSREETVIRAAAPLNPSKQFLYKVLGALVPHSFILPPPSITFMQSSPMKVIALQSPDQILSPYGPKSNSPTFSPSPSSSSSPSCGYSGSPTLNYIDADSILSGFKCPLGVVVSMAVRACSDPDHLVRVPAVSFLGLLSPEQWKALSVTCSVTSPIHVINSYVSNLCPEKVPLDHSSIDTHQLIPHHSGNTATAHVHVTSVIRSLLQACGDSMGTVRVAGFKAFGDGTLNGALSLSPLFTPILTSEEMDRGGDWRMPVGDSGLGELSLDNMLTCLRKGCIDTKLAVRLQATYALGNVLQLTLPGRLRHHLQDRSTGSTWLALFRICRKLLEDSDKILASAVRCLGFLVASAPNSSSAVQSSPLTGCVSAVGSEEESFISQMEELVEVLTFEVLLCAPKNSVNKGITVTNSETIGSAYGSSISGDSFNQHSARVEEMSVSSDPSLLPPLLSRRAVKLAIEKQSPKLLFSVCQALGSVGCVLLRVYLEKEDKNRKSANEVTTEGVNKRADNAHKETQCLRCIQRISTVLVAMLRYGLCKIQYQAAKAIVSLMTSFTDHWDRPKNLFTHAIPFSSEKGTGSDKEYSLEAFWNICNTELLESVLVTAIAINSSNSNSNSSTSSRVAYSTAAVPGDNIPLVKNIPGITRKTTTRTAKVTAAADRLTSLQHSLLMLLHLLTHSPPDTITRSTEKVAAQILFYHMDEVTEWLQFMQWDESILSLSDIMLELPLVRPGGRCILEDYPTPRSLVVSISENVMRIMEESEVIGNVDRDAESQFRNPLSAVDHTGSMISTATQKKLKKLSMLPRQRENIDFLSATLPILSTTSCTDSPRADFITDTAELEEDEI